MPKYVLDTTAVSALMKGEASAVARLEACARTEVLVPQPVLAEIAYGLARLPSSKRKSRLQSRFESIAGNLERVPWTDEVSLCFGSIKAGLERRGTPIEDFDIAIAAHAVVHDAVLASSNVRHMSRIPALRVEDWANAPT